MTRNATRFVTLLVATVLMGAVSAFAGASQGPGLSYDVTSGSYTAISGGTLHATSDDIGSFAGTVNLPFNMTWNGNSYSTLTVAGSGQVWIGGTSTNAVWAWETNMTGANNGTLRTTTLGTTPNRVFVVQWQNVTRSPQGSSNDRYNFQIRLHENGDVAEVVYGSMFTSAAVAPRIGARNANQSLTLFASYWYNTWERPYINMGNSVALDGWAPASGLTYQFHDRMANDAAITALTSPSGKFNAGATQTIKVQLTNHGSNDLDSVVIYWAINGFARTTVNYYANPALEPGESVEVQLGTASFAALSFNTLVARSAMPNGVSDVNDGNDLHQVYLAPRVEGRLNVAQGSGNAGVFPTINAAIRHLVASGTSDDVDMHIFSGNYSEQLLLPEIDGGDMITLMAAKGAEPVITWQPSNNPDYNLGLEMAVYQAYVFNDAMYSFMGLEFAIPNGLDWGGNIMGDRSGTVVVDNCYFPGSTNFLAQTNPAPAAVRLDGQNATVTNSVLEMVGNGIYITGSNTTVSGNSLSNIGGFGIISFASDMDINNNTVACSEGSLQNVGIYASGAGMIENNVVSGDNSSQTGALSYGIYVESFNGTGSGPHGIDVINNMIAVASEDFAVGIPVFDFATLDATRIYHNSVNVTGVSGRADSDYGAPGFFLVLSNGDVEVVNNIFHSFGTGTNGGVAVALNGTDLPLADFNDLMTTGPMIGRLDDGNTVTFVPRDAGANPLASWRAATGGDNNSSSVAVDFVGGADLHIQQIDRALFGSSSLTGDVPMDIDGDDRNIPYMGADEIVPSVRILEQPVSQYACLGATVQLLCIAEVTPGATVTYQWYKDGVKLDGQTGAVLVIGSIGYGASGVYTCNVEATDGFNEIAVMSDPASLIVVRQTTITMQPISQPVAPGGTVVLEVSAEAIGAPTDFVPAYQWKKWYWDVNSTSYQTVNVEDNGRITGAQSSRLTIRDIQDSDTADVYVCTVTGYCGEATSKQANLFFPTVAASNNTPNACEGGNIQIECAVIPSVVQGSGVNYAWYFDGAALSDGGDVTGSRTKVLTIANATTANNGDYYCLASYTGVGSTIMSNMVTVEVGAAPTIAAQPMGDTVCVGEAVSMMVDASGANISYQWMKGTTAIPGAVGMTYDIAAAGEADAGSYAVMVTNACGDVTSEVVDLVVNTAAEIVTEPTDIAVFDSDTIRFTVEASGTETIMYQWYKDGEMIDDATDATYEIVAGAFGDEAGDYYCIVTNECGSDTTMTVAADVTVGVAGGEILPGGYTLSNPMPNPTADVVAFTYALPSSQNVTITLTNMVGQEVATLVNGTMNSGTHRVEISAMELNLAPGAYTYMLQSNGTVAARQFIVVK